MSENDGAVKIAVRERPISRKTDENVASVIKYHANNIIVVKEQPYAFDFALGPDVGQHDIYDDLVKPLVLKTLQGYFCTTLAYGQTGTGKTFTMGLHTEYFEGESVGVVPRALRDVFKMSEDFENKPEISLSFVEIYNEKVYDLLAQDTNEQVNVKGFKFGGGVKKIIGNDHEGLAVLIQGNKSRHIRPTKMNPESSRSHAIFTIHVMRRSDSNSISSLLHLVDLAGSEGVRRTGHQGVALAEGVNINQGLLAIGKVLQALTCKRKPIPYRDSVLTSVLQDSFKPTSYITLLACISPYSEDLSETVTTLRFAENTKSLNKQHMPEINLILKDIQKNKAKTPQKNYQQPLRSINAQSKTPGPLKRDFSNAFTAPFSTIKKAPFHSNTFCTPNKKRKIEANKFNYSDIGLTPNAKLKYQSECVRPKFHPIPIQLPLETPNSHNDTIDSRSSLMSLNMSTSTALDVPISSNISTYSPIVRRCVLEIESTLEDKIEKMFGYMKELNMTCKEATVKKPEAPKEECETGLNSMTWASIRQEFQSIIREEIHSITINGKANEKNFDRDYEEVIDNLKCSTFAQSSPIFKVPAKPKRIPFDTTQLLSNDTIKSHTIFGEQTDETILFQDRNVTTNETIIPARRCSRRLSSTRERNDQPVRRSMRIERRNSTVVADDGVIKEPTTISTNNPKERRDTVRRSMRIESRAAFMPIAEENVKVVKKTRNHQTVPVKNKIIAEYFNMKITTKSTVKQLKDAKQNHGKAVLDLLNTGSIKELKILPQIGLKTAYQIITQRTLNGKFKNFAQVSKLPVWRGKGWERFKVANSIS